jgi:hypothetical protein
MTRRSTGIVLGIVVLLAAALRVAGVRFGLPAVYNPDEAAIMSRALGFAKGDLNPHNFLYPTLYFYVLFVWIGGYFVLARATGWVSSLGAFQASFFTDPTGIYLAGRLLGVVCGVVTVALVWRLAARLFGARTAMVAALLMAVAPFAVRDAHYVKHDVPVTLAVVAATLALWRVWFREPGTDDTHASQRSVTDVLAAATLIGVSVSTHYYAVFLILPLTAGILLRFERDGWLLVLTRLVMAGATVAGAFAVCSPFLLVDWQTAWRDIVANRQIVVDRALTSGGGGLVTLGRYLSMLSWEALGWPTALLSAAGGIWLAWRRPRHAAFLLLFPLPFFAFISNTVPASRYLNAVLPFAAILAAYALGELAALVPARARTLALVLAAIAAASPGLAAGIRNDWLFGQTDTRTLALQFIEAQVPSGAGVLIQPYSVPLSQSHASLREALEFHLGDATRASTKFAIRLALPDPIPGYRTIYLGDGGLDTDKIYVHYAEVTEESGLAALRAAGVQYVVLKQYNVREPATEPLRRALGRAGRLLATFSPYRSSISTEGATAAPFLHNTDARVDEALARPGPVIEVWQVRQ